MRLCYRGVEYDYVPSTVRVSEGEVLGQYRGLAWREHVVQSLSVSQPSFYLKYRGIPYWSNQVSDTGQAVEPQVALAQPVFTQTMGPETYGTPTRSAQERQRLAEMARVHQQNLRQRLNYRLERAKQRGDEALVHLLEAEQQQIA
jgi:hypothetical protein